MAAIEFALCLVAASGVEPLVEPYEITPKLPLSLLQDLLPSPRFAGQGFDSYEDSAHDSDSNNNIPKPHLPAMRPTVPIQPHPYRHIQASYEDTNTKHNDHHIATSSTS